MRKQQAGGSYARPRLVPSLSETGFLHLIYLRCAQTTWPHQKSIWNYPPSNRFISPFWRN